MLLALCRRCSSNVPTTTADLHTIAANPSHETREAFKGLFSSLKAHWQDLGVRFTDYNKVTLLCK